MEFCYKSASVIRIIGFIFVIFKIVIPIIIIIISSIEFGKAVMSGEEKDVKEQSIKLLKRFLIAVVIFILPSLVNSIYFSLVKDTDVKEGVNSCIICLTTPSECDTSYEPEILK